VIAKPDERWQERPFACVVRREGSDVSADDLEREQVGSERAPA
jgi:acyl-CoA synthetase (AMP-forming)/AMP-acid ligase II